jgi:hypothetical protein
MLCRELMAADCENHKNYVGLKQYVGNVSDLFLNPEQVVHTVTTLHFCDNAVLYDWKT